MVNRLVLLFLLVLFLGSCNSGSCSYQINGLLPDSAYDGEYIYLVPFREATAGNVDSALISNGRFSLKGKVEEPQIRILRMRPVLRFQLQELLVVAEPGLTEVVIDSVSSAKGTPENEILQEWKDRMMYFNEERSRIVRRVQETDQTDIVELKSRLQQLDKERSEYNVSFIEKYPGSVVSAFIKDTKK